jgi:UDP-4-amino-4-deoxy-L-arabinose formyltransferase/UDP-glucuronic acid dehydrogenase (UDP-4-keto-hexauronic acid decarboxylating)
MGITGLDTLKRCGFDIRAVFSHKDDPGENCWFGSVAKWAEGNRIPLFCPESVNTPVWIRKISDLEPGAIFSFYYRKLIPGEILCIPLAGAYNLHGSLLPAYRGRCPVNWVLVNGEKNTGVTLHHMVEKADAGDIVGRKTVEIDFADTAFTLSGKLCRAAEALLMETLPLIKNGSAPRIPQQQGTGSYFGGRYPEDGRINWHWPSQRIYNLVRAVTYPYPGAFTLFPDGRKMIVWWGLPMKQATASGVPGMVETVGDDAVVVTGETGFRLTDVEVDGAKLSGRELVEYFKNREGVVLA